MSQSGNSLAQKSGTLPDRQKSSRILFLPIPDAPQLSTTLPPTLHAEVPRLRHEGGWRSLADPTPAFARERAAAGSDLFHWPHLRKFSIKTETPGRKSRSRGKNRPRTRAFLIPLKPDSRIFRFRKIFGNFAPKNSEKNNERKKPNENERK
jgi:hypothetical protein